MRNIRVPRRLLWAPILLLLGCEQTVLRREHHPNGRLSEEQAFLLAPNGGSPIPHGFHQTWYPDGARRGLEMFIRGARQGYSMRWSEDGRLVRLEYCADGVCEDRTPPESHSVAFERSP